MEITFVRHGPPEFDSARWLHRYDMKQLLVEYDASRVVSSAPENILAMHSTHSDIDVFCSAMPRSVDSACALGFPDAIQLAELNEAALPCPDSLKIPVPYRTAIVALRLAWFLGYSSEAESYHLVQMRASDATAKLIDIASTREKVLVIGHGIMNRLVCQKLKKVGWTVEARNRSGYWSMIRVAHLSNGANRANS